MEGRRTELRGWRLEKTYVGASVYPARPSYFLVGRSSWLDYFLALACMYYRLQVAELLRGGSNYLSYDLETLHVHVIIQREM